MQLGRILSSWNKTHIFTALIITQCWLDNAIIIISFSDNATIMKEINSCFLRIASKAPIRIQKIYTQDFNGYGKQPTTFFFPNKCFMKKWRLKFQVSKYHLKWNTQNYDKFNVPKIKTQLYTVFTSTTGNWLKHALGRWQSQPARYIRSNYYIRPHLDARRFFLNRVFHHHGWG